MTIRHKARESQEFFFYPIDSRTKRKSRKLSQGGWLQLPVKGHLDPPDITGILMTMT